MNDNEPMYLKLFYGKSEEEIKEDMIKSEKYYDSEDPAGYPEGDD